MSKLPFVLVLFAILASSDCHADLVAHWTGNGTTADSSGNGHTGALMNGAQYGVGKFGQAFRFDGVNDFVAIPGDNSLEPTEITLALWVNAGSSNTLRILADSSHGGSGGVNQNGWALQLNTSNRVSFAYGNGSTFPELTSNTVVADGTFHHVAATLSGSTMQIYVDGNLDVTGAYTGTPTQSNVNNGEIRLGNHYQFSRPLNGSLDDVRIYNNVLSVSEIQSLNVSAVPEPSAAFVILMGLGAVAIRRERRTR